MSVLDCQKFRDYMISEAKGKVDNIVKQYSRKPKLVVVQVKGDDASDVYIRNKKKCCEECGIEFTHILLPNSVQYKSLVDCLKDLNRDSTVNGILLQLPLPSHLKDKQEELLNIIDWKKDVDGLTSENVGRLWSGRICLIPCTAGGIMRLLPEDMSGINVLVVNRSALIGKPLVALLQSRNATVTLAHSKTSPDELNRFYTCNNVIITATGRAKVLKLNDVLTGNRIFPRWCVDMIVDGAMNRDENGELCGDVDVESFDETNIMVTPTPKGTGILTVAQLMLNICEAFVLQKESYHEIN